MFWIVQDNLHREDGFDPMIQALERLDIPHAVVQVVPFSHEIIPDLRPDGRVMVCGSTTLATIAKSRGWIPGSFHNENHDYRVWLNHYHAYLLNADSWIGRFADVAALWDPFFIRPCEDTKTFSGRIMTTEEFVEWQRRVIDLRETYTTLDGDTMVVVSPLQTIRKEFRFFVVDRAIITGSVYKIGSRVVYQSLVDEAATRFAEAMIALWVPARAFVLDVAQTEDETGATVYKIIEINCLNSAGFYACDMAKVVMAIEAMVFPEATSWRALTSEA